MPLHCLVKDCEHFSSEGQSTFKTEFECEQHWHDYHPDVLQRLISDPPAGRQYLGMRLCPKADCERMCFSASSYNVHVASCTADQIDERSSSALDSGSAQEPAAAMTPDGKQSTVGMQDNSGQVGDSTAMANKSSDNQAKSDATMLGEAADDDVGHSIGAKEAPPSNLSVEETQRRLRLHEVALNNICPVAKRPQFRAYILASGYRYSTQDIVDMAMDLHKGDQEVPQGDQETPSGNRDDNTASPSLL